MKYYAMKLDMRKAYVQVEWGFLQVIMLLLDPIGIPPMLTRDIDTLGNYCLFFISF
jgi:hypothetical protein